jgi:DNA end-binding protein Ku
MARAMWSGSISFGLVSVPIKLYSAIADKSIRFHLLDKKGTCRLREKLYCPETGKEYDFTDTARGFELAPNQYVILDKGELAALKPEAGDILAIKDFVDLEEIDPIYFDRTYYLGPDRGGSKPYRLLYEAMKRTGKAGIGSFVMRGHEYLAAVRVGDEILYLETLHYAEDIRSTDEAGKIGTASIDKRELTLATELIDSWTTAFKPEKYHNEYRDRLEEAINKKAKGRSLASEQPRAQGRGKVIDLMDALKASIREKSVRGKNAAKKKPKRNSAVKEKNTHQRSGRKRKAG